ncbi:hypothetical protein CQW23_30170 [Capsicum baccatum]|uniref:Uncharacterized protein n=1 Tax=Capsicum baccatum TaxID=33114 RepID=A0A2G2VB65_CAPBA|nr:hypothetical protein CQW23_30170 [Capsicum baccatum]
MAAFTLTLTGHQFLNRRSLHKPFKPFRNLSRSISCSTQPEKEPFKPITEEKILEAVAYFNGAEKTLTAAAADGGEAAGEHIAAGINAMVVETLFPWHMNEHSTVSTRLFLPSRKVMEKAQKLRSALTKEMLSSTTSINLLAMTFRQVLRDTDRLSSVIPLLSAERANYRPWEGRWMVNWLTSNAYSKLEQTGGPEFIAWLSEYVPAYKLQIDADKLGNVKFDRWKETATNKWEVFLIHSQMVTPCSLNFCFLHPI